MSKALHNISTFLHKPFFSNGKTLFGLWALLGIVSAITRLHSHNNFLIFRNVFWHTVNGQSLFAYYPAEYHDHNLYGPLFSIIIAPFALAPEWLGMILWCFALSMLLWWAITYLPKTTFDLDGQTTACNNVKIFTLWFCANELLTALFMQQFNIAVAALIVLTFVFVQKEKDHWAALCIVIGTFVKIYPIVGIAFFFFSKHKWKFVLWLVVWSVICFFLPFLISSPDYQLGQWSEWFQTLSDKDAMNALSGYQNISLMGMIRKIGYACVAGHEALVHICHTPEASPDATNWWYTGFNDLWVILFGLIVMAAGFFQVHKWQSKQFRYKVLASILMFVVLFSTGSESCGYIIALVGCCIWFCVSTPKSRCEARWNIALMVLAFIVTSLSPSDIFPKYIRHDWIQPYALKALPVVLIWLKVCYELIFEKVTEHK